MRYLVFALSVLTMVAAYGQVTYKVKLNKDLSSPYYDFAPRFVDENCQTMILSSSRSDSKDTSDSPYHNIFYTTLRKNGKWKKPQAFDTTTGRSSNAIISVDHKRKVIFLTKCPRTTDRKVGCDIYYSFMQGPLIGETIQLNIDRPEFDGQMLMGHPYFSNELEILFFVAVDWPGGYGGNDIWFSKYDRATDTWGKPQNMGPHINTPFDDHYPYLHPDGTFYFTSDGHPGQGAWDIFKARLVGDLKWGKVENMGVPINSDGDDFGIIFTRNTNAGYFSSIRGGGLGKDDIYEFIADNAGETIPDTSLSVTESIDALTTIFNKEECTSDFESLKISSSNITPNPSNGQFSFSFKTNIKADLSIRIFSNNGQLISFETVSVNGQFTKQYNLKWGAGIYYVQLLFNCDALMTEKVVIE